MNEHLFIRLEAAGSDECSTVVLSGDGRIVRPVERGTLAAAAPEAVGRRVTLLLPGLDVVTTQVALPASSRARLRQMLPFSLEETFAEDVDRLLFAPGRRLDSGEVRVSVVARAQLDDWLERAAAVGIQPGAVYSEGDGVPDTPSTLSLVLDGERIYGRRPGRAAFVFEGLDIDELYDLLVAQGEDRTDLQYVDAYVDAGEQERHRAALDRLEPRVASLNRRVLADGVLARLAATLVAQSGTNLLQGPYAPKSDTGALLRPWYAAAGLAVALGVVVLVAQAVDYFSLRSEDAALDEVLAAACQERVGSTRLSACRQSVEQRLGAAGLSSSLGGGGFLTTLAAIAEHSDERSRLQALSYRNGSMDLQIAAPSIPALDEFAQAISQTQRYEVQIQSTTPTDDHVDGRLQIVGATP